MMPDDFIHEMAPKESEKDGADATLLQKPLPVPGSKEEETKGNETYHLVGPLEIFRYATKWDKLLVFCGIFCAMVNGAAFPLMLIIVGKSIEYFVEVGKLNLFLLDIHDFLGTNNLTKMEVLRHPGMLDPSLCNEINHFYGGNITCTISLHQGIYDKMTDFAVYFSALGCVVLVFGYAQVCLWIVSSERQANHIRRACLYNVLHQNIGWFDVHNANELNNRLSDDIIKIQDGIGDKMGTFFQWLTTSIVCFITGFAYGWKLSLVILGLCPLICIVAGLNNELASAFSSKELKEYAKAGGIAEEAFGAIRTVVSVGGQDKMAARYYKNLDDAHRYGKKKGVIHGLSMSVFNMVMLLSEGLSLWYGGKLHRDEPENYTPDIVLIVFLTLVMAGFSLGNAAPSLQSLATARGAAYAVFKLIELKSPINSSSDEGKKPSDLKGSIEFKNVQFAYPARPDVKVLSNVNIEVHPGQTVAFVGASGCGKSTTVQLLLRFYDPDQGQILLDGQDIRELNIKWLRKNIGLVSQEPVLFATTIAENIQYGSEDVTMDEIIKAAKDANAYDFIMQLPEKFETYVGERGAQLSGGQKQRIAIARALVRNPKILLLDEATSSLDTESESIVQDALDKACKGRTTIVIAHRLSTIKNADMIVGLQDGRVIERGTHDELMDHKGIYHQLVMNQVSSENEADGRKDIVDKTNLEITSNNRLSQSLSLADYENEQLNDDDDLPNAPFTRLLKMNLPEWYFIILGLVGSIINGCMAPAVGVLFSSVMNSFSEDEETQEKDFENIAIVFVILAGISVITYFLQGSMFAFSGEALTVRLRDHTFRAMLRQDIAWFDDDKNGVGALTTRLSTDVSQVQGATGVRLGALLMGLSNSIGALVVAFSYGWKMTFVLLAFLPFMALGDFIRIRMFAGQSDKSKEALEDAGKITVESVGNIRTVASLSKEQTFFSLYMEKLEAPYKTALRNAHIVGMAFSFSQSATYFFYASAFVFGAYMIEDGEMIAKDVFRVFCSFVFGAVGLGNASGFTPDLGKAQTSAKRILQILDAEPTINHASTGGKKLMSNYSANLTFKNVSFHYPSRQTAPVLQDLNISVASGETIALVGSSGCGKTTTVQLIERFYDTVAGGVCLDNHDIKTLNVPWLRSQMALVSQEPALFDLTIAENIAFGDNSREVTKEEIIAAARTANIHNFITSLPNGYDTNVGSKGTQLSGGQKQRIAIARALICKPKILLLDEATSSLDTESEKVIREALDKARKGLTCVIIAHRLSTVQNVDKICVVSDGRVTEQGTHSELMAVKGFYHRLVEKSMRTV